MITSVSQEHNNYQKFCLSASKDEHIFNSFRSNAIYNVILEHVTYEDGNKYFDYILNTNKFLITEKIIDIVQEVDEFGGPKRYEYQPFGFISPTMLRYLSVISDIVKIHGPLSNKTVCEIGAGYGGLALMIDKIYNVKNYVIVDLPEVNELTKTFLIKNKADLSKYKFYTTETLKTIKSDYVISNYAFSECFKPIQDDYLNKIINKTKQYYMILNFAWGNRTYSLEELCDKIKIGSKQLPEVPLSHPINVSHPHNVLLIN